MLALRKIALLCILLILSTPLAIGVVGGTEEQAECSMSVTGYTWDHPILTVSVFPQDNESWWDQSYLYAVLHGVAQWNDAIEDFAANQPEFSYLAELRFVAIITHEDVEGLDIYVEWIDQCENETEIGEAQATVLPPCEIVNATVSLTAQAPSGHVMTETDMQNIVVHELGHTLGLYHSNCSEDVMYHALSYSETVTPLSSLDLYAVAQIFEPLLNSTSTEADMCPKETEYTLPQNIPYSTFSIAEENRPETTPNVADLLLSPEILTVLIVAVALLVILALIVRQRRKPQEKETVS